jgi:hypothetical protein
VVDVDVKEFFDHDNHDVLMGRWRAGSATVAAHAVAWLRAGRIDQRPTRS